MLTTLEVISIVLYCMLSICIVSSNFFVIITILTIRKLRMTPNLLLVSLALVDLITGAVTVPFRICEIYRIQFTLDIDYCRVSHCLTLLNVIGSVLHLVVIAIERFIAIDFPFKYIRMISRSGFYLLIPIILIWVVTLCTAFLPLYAWGSNREHGSRSNLFGICKFNETLEHDFVFTVLLGIVALSIIIITTLNFRIYLIARRHMRRVGPSGFFNDHKNSNDNLQSIKESETVNTAHKQSISDNLSISQSNSIVLDSSSFPNNIQSEEKSSHSDKNFSVTSTCNTLSEYKFAPPEDTSHIKKFQRKRRKSFLRSWKTTKTMFLIFLVFSVCWLAFIIPTSIFLTCPLCADATVVMISTVVIFSSSAFNPFIFYIRVKIFRQETAKAFNRLLSKIC